MVPQNIVFRVGRKLCPILHDKAHELPDIIIARKRLFNRFFAAFRHSGGEFLNPPGIRAGELIGRIDDIRHGIAPFPA